MNTRKLALISLMIIMIAAVAFPTLAAEKTVTVTLTETDVNSAYRVSNPARRTITDVYVDLQPEQVVITATFTAPRTNPIPVSVTMTPSITNGRVYWTVNSATADGKAASGDLLTQINTSISSSWRNYMKGKTSGKVTSITVTDDTLSWTKVTTK